MPLFLPLCGNKHSGIKSTYMTAVYSPFEFVILNLVCGHHSAYTLHTECIMLHDHLIQVVLHINVNDSITIFYVKFTT